MVTASTSAVVATAASAEVASASPTEVTAASTSAVWSAEVGLTEMRLAEALAAAEAGVTAAEGG